MCTTFFADEYVNVVHIYSFISKNTIIILVSKMTGAVRLMQIDLLSIRILSLAKQLTKLS